ncbi:MAG: 3-hydroxyacyl-ACP dehydratase FabZ family protein [Gemmatimonadota bacterium]|nr:3-hydroxyacyl-ACP dehydratase FabZ family protein [Gemmatimonadota bacterium]
MSATDAAGVALTPEQILELLPQQEPFRFVNEILEVDEDHIVATYRYPPESDFYRGHFPGNPVTPGVILLETMAQVSVVALGIYLVGLRGGVEEVRRTLALFADAEVEFSGVVRPGERVTVHASKVFYRRGKIRSEAEMTLDDGSVVCTATISGMGVPA